MAESLEVVPGDESEIYRSADGVNDESVYERGKLETDAYRGSAERPPDKSVHQNNCDLLDRE